MRYILALIIVFAGVAVSAVGSDFVTPQKIVCNEGFEGDFDSCRIKGLEVVTDKSGSHTGTRCLKGFEPKSQSGPHEIRLKPDLTPNALYRAEIWLRSDNKCAASIGLADDAVPDRHLITRFYDIPDEWTRYDVLFRLPKSEKKEILIVGPHTWAGRTGTVWVDDITITEIAHCAALPITSLDDYVQDCALAKSGPNSAELLYMATVPGVERSLTGDDLALQQSNGSGLMGFDHEESHDRIVSMIWKSGKWSESVEIASGLLFHPAVAVNDNGVVCAIWSEKTSGARWSIMCRIRKGSKWSKPFQVSSNSGSAWFPAVIADSKGEFWCAWTGHNGPCCGVYLVAINENVSGKAILLSADGRSSYKPDLAVDSDGRVWAAWYEFDGQSYNIIARNASGSIFGERMIIAGTSEDETHVTMTPSPKKGGGMWFVYDVGSVPKIPGESGQYTLARRINIRCEIAHWKDGRVTGLYPEYGRWPGISSGELGQLVFDANGNIWLFERTSRAEDIHWDVAARRWTGSGWTQPHIVSGGKQGLWFEPHVMSLDDGILLVWQADDRDRAGERCKAYGQKSFLCSQIVHGFSQSGSEPDGEPQIAHIRPNIAIEKPSERFTVEYNGKKFYVLWGELHTHSRWSESVEDLNPFDTYAFNRDMIGIDFMALTDHGYYLNFADRFNTRKLTDLQNCPNGFVSILGQETSSNRQIGKNGIGYGHWNIYYLNDQRFWIELADTTQNTPVTQWDALKRTEADAFTIPHQIADAANLTELDWSFHNDKYQPVAEIYQIRGSYEYLGCPWQARAGAKTSGCYYQDALKMGHHIGVIAASDHGGGHGLTAVFVENPDRESIFRAIQNRRCYGTTEAYILLDFRVNGHLMGEIVKDRGCIRTISARIEALRSLKEVVVFKNGNIVYQEKAPIGKSHSFKFTDNQMENAEDWYYLRAIQDDGKIAWSSPVWVTCNDAD